jgi:predicted TIM-barrel fold metal-dependent hydrolase
MTDLLDSRIESRLEAARAQAGHRYMVISADDHAGPRPSQHFRQYCPPKYLAQFDEFCAEQDALARQRDQIVAEARARIKNGTATVRDLSIDQLGNCRDCAGHYDVNVRLRDMDADGVAAQIIFAGGQNDTEMPWVGFGWNAGPKEQQELKEASYRMWNQWISDFVSAAPDRLLGVMQVPIWNIEAAVREVEWCAEHGLRVVNLHAPRDDYPDYTDPIYDPFWEACSAIGATLATHAGASAPYTRDTPQTKLLYLSEFHWFGNRGLAQLIWGGIFERWPNLKFVLTEQRVDFAPALIRHLNSLYHNRSMQLRPVAETPHGGIIAPDWPADPTENASQVQGLREPGEYWRDHCYLSGSFLAPFEVALRHEVGLGNLLWGTDYPHCEGTWPHTRVAMRHTFASVPEEETRLILGENAVDVYHFDRDKLRAIADRIGPLPEDLRKPVDPEEIPLGQSWAFRQEGNFS